MNLKYLNKAEGREDDWTTLPKEWNIMTERSTIEEYIGKEYHYYIFLFKP